MMPVAAPQILNPLSYRQDEHHRNDGYWSESLEGEWHIIVFCSTIGREAVVGYARNLRPVPTLLDPNSIIH